MNNPNDFRVSGFRDSRAARGTYLNAATTKTWDIRTAVGVAGGTSIASGTLSYVTASQGEYVGGPTAADLEDLVEDTTYYLYLRLVEGDVEYVVNPPIVAVRRLGTNPVS